MICRHWKPGRTTAAPSATCRTQPPEPQQWLHATAKPAAPHRRTDEPGRQRQCATPTAAGKLGEGRNDQAQCNVPQASSGQAPEGACQPAADRGRVLRPRCPHCASASGSLTDAVSKNGGRITYEKRQLLGFTPTDIEQMRSQLIDHLTHT